jgi:RNA polymerase sigma factor (sigma-70 family)
MRSFEEGKGSAFVEASDGHLFALMERRTDEGREAWGEFYRRYVADFYRFVSRLRGLSSTEAEELVQETMIQAYKAAHTFQAVEGLEPEVLRRRTLAWLGRIARNIHYERLRGQKINMVVDTERQSDERGAPYEEQQISRTELHRRIRESEDAVAGVAPAANTSISDERQLLRDALAQLPERELDILVVSYEYYEQGETHPHLPKAVVAELCARHGVSSANLRKIRERARKQVAQYIEANSRAKRRG